MKRIGFGLAALAAIWGLSWGGPSGCGGVTCGDGVIGGKEICDGGALNGESCESQGFSPEGTLACADDCGSFNTAGCVDRGTVSGLTFVSGDKDEFVIVAPDPKGHSYLNIRSASPSVTVGELSLANPAATPASPRGAAAKLNNDGTAAWLVPFEGNGAFGDNGPSFAFDLSGNAFFTGDYYGTTLTVPDRSVTNADPTGNTIDAFAGRFNADGSIAWFDNFQSTEGDQVFMVFDDAGNLYLDGNFNGTSLTVGSTTLNNTDGVGNTSDRFIARLDPSTGTAAWITQFGSDSNDNVFMTTDSDGHLFFWGEFQGTKLKVNGTDELTNVDPTKTTHDGFIGRLDPATGDLLWIKAFSSASFDFPTLIVDALDRVYVFGRYLSPTISANGTTLNNLDPGGTTEDNYVARINPEDGSLVWLIGMGSVKFDMVQLTTDAAGDVFVTGMFDGPTFFSGSKSVANADSGGTSTDNFVARLNPADGSTEWITGLLGPGFPSGFMGPFPIGADKDGNVYLVGGYRGASLNIGDRALTNADPSGATSDIFAVKFAADGSVVWVTSFSGDDDEFLSPAFDADGNLPVSSGVFLSGSFLSESVTGAGETLTNVDATKTTQDAFIASLNHEDGSLVWLLPFSSAGDDFASLVADDRGHLRFIARFEAPTLEVAGQTFTNKDPTGTTLDVVVGKVAP